MKSRYSSKEGCAECLVGFQRYCLFRAASEKPNYQSKCLLSQANEMGQRNQGKAARTGNSQGRHFHQDNAKPHTSFVTRKKLLELGWEVVPDLPYIPDLAPSDYHLFRLLQNYLNGKTTYGAPAPLQWRATAALFIG